MIEKPMLAGTIEHDSDIKFPVAATPKIDGIRCLKIAGKALGRSLKPIGNAFVREWVETNMPDGVDGELIVHNRTFHELSGDIRRGDGKPDFQFIVFDFVPDPQSVSIPYVQRIERLLAKLGKTERHVVLEPITIRDHATLAKFEETVLAAGYEGVILRDPNGRYKFGRSTVNEGMLLKLKRFTDSEAVVIGFEEENLNTNVAVKNELGRTKRSRVKAGLVPKGTLGTIIARWHNGAEFGITGFDEKTRAEIWTNRERLTGQVVKFKYFQPGTDKAPRHATFLGFRDPNDMDAS